MKITRRRLVALCVLLFLCVLATYAAILATDTFARANQSPISGGPGAWQSISGSCGLLIFSNVVRPISAADTCAEVSNAVSWPNDQWNQFQIVTLTAGGFIGPMVRGTTAALTGYVVLANGPTGTPATTTLARYNAGTQIPLKTATATWQVGDFVYLEIQGTALVVKQCNPACTTIAGLSTTDSNISSGKTGIFMYSVTGNLDTINNWSGGDFSSAVQRRR